MDIFTILFHQPIFNLLVVLYRAFGDNLGLAIVGLAIFSRLITLPITMRQMKMAEQSKEFNEKVKEIKAKYKNDKEQEQKELMQLQSQFLPAQLGGCLPLILQFIFLINIFHVISQLFAEGATAFNQYAYGFVPGFAEGTQLNTSFFGVIDLALSPGQIGYENILSVVPYLLLAVLVGATQYFSTQILMGQRKRTEAKKEAERSEKEKDTPKYKLPQKPESKDNQPEDFGEIMQRSTNQTMKLFPILTIFFALNFPAGLSLYWTMQSGFVIIQQLVTDRLRK